MTALEEAMRAELIALTELRSAVADVAANRGNYWTRPGSRESAQQIGEQDAFKRVLQMIDGRLNRDRKSGRQSEGTPSGAGSGERVARGAHAEALVLPAEVVPSA